jgi:carnosine synthase
MPKRETLLLIAPGFRPELLQTPKEMDFHLVVAAAKPPADSALYDEFIQVNETDEEAVCRAVQAYLSGGGRIDAIACYFEGSIHIAAVLCERLGLPGNSPAAVRNMRDKFRTFEVLTAAGVATPRTEIAWSATEAEEAGRRLGFPLVMKPQASAASQGVIKIADESELAHAFKLIDEIFDDAVFGAGESAVPNIGRVLNYPGAHGVLLQSYVEGPEVCLDIVYRDGEFDVLGMMDKPFEWAEPYFLERLVVTPSRLPVAAQRAIEDTSIRALRACGATCGAAHVEARLNAQGEPVIIEVNGRLGGMAVFVQETIQLSTGRWGLAEYLNVATGRPITPATRNPRPAGFVSLSVETFGRIKRFAGESEVRALPGVVDIQWAMAPGDSVPEGYPRNPRVNFAHVLVCADSYDQVLDTMNRAREQLVAVVE